MFINCENDDKSATSSMSFPEGRESKVWICSNVLSVISHPSFLGSVDCLATPELGSRLVTDVDKQKQMVGKDKIAVFVYCSVYFLQNLTF